MTANAPSIVVLCGGVGAARFLAGLLEVVPPESVTAIINVGDDLELHGLHVSPDIDTIAYTLSGEIDPERGWGLAGETWHARAMVERYGGSTWFQLGDRDLGTHLFRTERLRSGATLSEVTADIAAAWGLGLQMRPVTDDPLRTKVTVQSESAGSGSEEIDFQQYFVARQHSVPVTSVRFAGADDARPSPGVIEAIRQADCVVIAPSNPVVSIGPVLAVPGVHDAVRAARERTVAVSPIIGGAALKGPADRLLAELGHGKGLAAVLDCYGDTIGHLVADSTDAAEAAALPISADSPELHLCDTIMATPERAQKLALETLAAVGLDVPR